MVKQKRSSNLEIVIKLSANLPVSRISFNDTLHWSKKERVINVGYHNKKFQPVNVMS